MIIPIFICNFIAVKVGDVNKIIVWRKEVSVGEIYLHPRWKEKYGHIKWKNCYSPHDDTRTNTHLECVHPLAALVQVVHEVHREVGCVLFVCWCCVGRAFPLVTLSSYFTSQQFASGVVATFNSTNLLVGLLQRLSLSLDVLDHE